MEHWHLSWLVYLFVELKTAATIASPMRSDVHAGSVRRSRPGVYSRRFARLVHRLELDGVRLHDLRHAFGTALLGAGVHPKVASEALGHASVAFTMDTYQHVLPSLGDQAATAIDAAFGDAVRGKG
jgi:integrase